MAIRHALPLPPSASLMNSHGPSVAPEQCRTKRLSLCLAVLALGFAAVFVRANAQALLLWSRPSARRPFFKSRAHVQQLRDLWSHPGVQRAAVLAAAEGYAAQPPADTSPRPRPSSRASWSPALPEFTVMGVCGALLGLLLSRLRLRGLAAEVRREQFARCTIGRQPPSGTNRAAPVPEPVLQSSDDVRVCEAVAQSEARRQIVLRGVAAALTLPCASAALATTTDRCLEEREILGAYVNPCQSDRVRVFQWESVGRVSIEQGDVGPGATGAAVWTAGTALASYLANEPGGAASVRGRRVIELGCGAGLCGIVAARLGAREVLLTDGNAELLERAARNVSGNVPAAAAAAVAVRPLLWGDDVDAELSGAFDVVLASDVLYQSAAWLPLAACVRELLRPEGQGVLLLAEAGHAMTPAASALRGFASVATGAGLVLEEPVALGYGNTLLVRATVM